MQAALQTIMDEIAFIKQPENAFNAIKAIGFDVRFLEDFTKCKGKKTVLSIGISGESAILELVTLAMYRILSGKKYTVDLDSIK